MASGILVYFWRKTEFCPKTVFHQFSIKTVGDRLKTLLSKEGINLCFQLVTRIGFARLNEVKKPEGRSSERGDRLTDL